VCSLACFFLFFFSSRSRHTRFSRDWSSDVCSSDLSKHPIGSGPFHFLTWQGSLELERLSDGQRFILQEVKDPTVRVLKLLRGEIDLLQGDLLPELVRYLKRQPHIQVNEVKGSNFSYLGFNLLDER